MKMKTVQMMFVLFIVGVISSVMLSYTAQFAYPLIEENRQIVLKKSILQVLPEAKSYEVVNQESQIYRGFIADGELAGYAFIGKGGGYQGIIKIMIGIEPDWGTLQGIFILENIETPGLGAKITTENFLKQFQGLEVQPAIEYVQNKPPQQPNQIQAITGATISSRAVVNILNKTIQRVETQIK